MIRDDRELLVRLRQVNREIVVTAGRLLDGITPAGDLPASGLHNLAGLLAGLSADVRRRADQLDNVVEAGA